MQETFLVTVDRYAFGKLGIGHVRGVPVFVWNALPGETVRARAVKRRRKYWEAVAEEVLDPSPHRIDPHEPDHYLSCSPWQIVSFSEECRAKEVVSREVFQRIAGISPAFSFEAGDEEMGYRNKLEYSFVNTPEGISFAFFERGSKRKVPLASCALRSHPLAHVSSFLLEWLRAERVRAEQMKSLVLRCNQEGKVAAVLFVADASAVKAVPELPPFFSGMQIYYSRPEHPAASCDALVAEKGTVALEEEIGGVPVRFSALHFFQVNIPLFQKVIQKVRREVAGADELVDIYAGSGSLSLPCADSVSRCVLVEIDEHAVSSASATIRSRGFKNAEAQCAPAERVPDVITPGSTVLVDPPRVGLHSRVLRRIIEAKPRMVVYLSCNIATQARDLAMLKGEYILRDLTLYNFFPRTPHIESLAILELER